MPTKITPTSKPPKNESTESPRTDKPTATNANNIAAICNILLTSLRKMTEPRCMLFATQFTPWCKGYHQLETVRSDVCHTAKHPAITASISSAQGPDAIATGPTTQPSPLQERERRRANVSTISGELNDYGNAYSTIALTWGRKPAGGFNSTDAAWSPACIK